MARSDRAGHQQVDATALLSFTSDLHAMRGRVDASGASDEQRRRWQNRLAAISHGAAADLDRAASQLRRMAADLHRHGA